MYRFACVFSLMLAVLAFAAADGWAQSLMGEGGAPVNTGFSCQNGSPSGELLNAGQCPASPDNGKIFSYFICHFESILNETLSKVYCAVVFEASAPVMAALTLLVSIAGVMFLMGMTPFTAKELMILAAKFSLVMAFALNAEYMIGIGYNLMVSMTKEGIVMVLEYLFPAAEQASDSSAAGGDQFSGGSFSGGVNDVYALFDRTLSDFISYVTEGEKEGNRCQDSIFVMMIAIAAAVPPLALIGIYFVVKLLWMVLRAIFGYCQGLLGLTFLVVLAPIYVSFALFKPTRSLFDKWVKYLISFSFQMVIVFAFLGMVFYILDQIADDTQAYRELVKPYKQDQMQGAGVFNFFDTCGICKIDQSSPKDAPQCSGNEVVPLAEMTKNEGFLEFATVKVMAMVILFYVLDIMLSFVPEMAKHLAGPKYAGQLGGGAGGNMPIPGEQAVGTALSKAAKGFGSQNNVASGAVNGAVEGLIGGLQDDGGVIDTMIRSTVNPNDPYRTSKPGEVDTSLASNLFGAAAGLTGAYTLGKHWFGGEIQRPAVTGTPSATTTTSTGGSDRASAEQHAANIQRESQPVRRAEPRSIEAARESDTRVVHAPGTTAGRGTGNPALASTIERTIAAAIQGKPMISSNDLEIAFSQVAGSDAEKLAALKEIDTNNFDNPEVAAWIRSKIALG